MCIAKRSGAHPRRPSPALSSISSDLRRGFAPPRPRPGPGRRVREPGAPRQPEQVRRPRVSIPAGPRARLRPGRAPRSHPGRSPHLHPGPARTRSIPSPSLPGCIKVTWGARGEDPAGPGFGCFARGRAGACLGGAPRAHGVQGRARAQRGGLAPAPAHSRWSPLPSRSCPALSRRAGLLLGPPLSSPPRGCEDKEIRAAVGRREPRKKGSGTDLGQAWDREVRCKQGCCVWR